MKAVYSILFIALCFTLSAQEVHVDPRVMNEFDRLFQKDGGRLDSAPTVLGDFLQRARHFVDSIHCTIPLSPRPYVDLISNLGFNAKAKVTSNRYYIGIYEGTPIILSDVFLSLLSNKNTFVEIGDPLSEQTLAKVDVAALFSLRQRYADRTPMPIPVDQI